MILKMTNVLTANQICNCQDVTNPLHLLDLLIHKHLPLVFSVRSCNWLIFLLSLFNPLDLLTFLYCWELNFLHSYFIKNYIFGFDKFHCNFLPIGLPVFVVYIYHINDYFIFMLPSCRSWGGSRFWYMPNKKKKRKRKWTFLLKLISV